MNKIAVVFGTRPEAIKLAPVIKELEKARPALEPLVIVTAQHREMLDQVLNTFDIIPDVDLDLMRPNQSLFDITSEAIPQLGRVLQELQPAIVVVQGDTTTTFAASLAASYLGIPVAHVEAGLRTLDKRQPFPEELNRRLTGVLADYHFAPTRRAKDNLLAEGLAERSVQVTGNTVIDALQWIKERLPEERSTSPFRRILATAHRRENWGPGIENICLALRSIAGKYDDIDIVFSCHLNPSVKSDVERLLGQVETITLTEPLDYAPFVRLMASSYLVLTDSGGIQEEAPALGKPVLVAREVTERPEGVEAGTVRLVGTSAAGIIHEMSLLLDDELEYALMANAINPYGDGKAAERIVAALADVIAGNYDLSGQPAFQAQANPTPEQQAQA